MRLVQASEHESSQSKSEGTQFEFYVTQETGKVPTGYFNDIDGVVPSFAVVHGIFALPAYARGRVLAPGQDHSGDIFVSPNGLVLIPATLLARLHCEAQEAALLSFVITAVLQKQGYQAWPIIMSPGSQWLSTGLPAPKALLFLKFQNNIEDLEYFGALQEEQQLRLGIRTMYLAGFDIREAPFAWSVAQGRAVVNPAIDELHPGRLVPWYAAYTFNFISHYYSDVDYSKLKRGETEYAQFLDELRKADPEAFERKK